MANRTIQLQGLSYGAVPSGITATLNGNVVFSGTVTTNDQPVPPLPDPSLQSQVYTLFSFDIDVAVTGNVVMTCQVTEGTVVFSNILSNYARIANPVYTSEQLAIVTSPTSSQADKVAIWTALANPPLTAEQQATLLDPATPSTTVNRICADHNLTPYLPTESAVAPLTGITNLLDPRFDVTLDGVTQDPTRDEPGCWWWQVNSGSTLSWQMNLFATTLQ
jgi:hypothetical protein